MRGYLHLIRNSLSGAPSVTRLGAFGFPFIAPALLSAPRPESRKLNEINASASASDFSFRAFKDSNLPCSPTNQSLCLFAVPNPPIAIDLLQTKLH
jgi:hypothetical protein